MASRKLKNHLMQPVFRSLKDRVLCLHCYFIYIKINASSIMQNGCHVRLFSAETSFLFSGDMCVTMQITSLTCKCPAVCFALYLHNTYLQFVVQVARIERQIFHEDLGIRVDVSHSFHKELDRVPIVAIMDRLKLGLDRKRPPLTRAG